MEKVNKEVESDSISMNESYVPKVENIGKEFMIWAEKYWKLDEVCKNSNNMASDSNQKESCPYSVMRDIFITKINQLHEDAK